MDRVQRYDEKDLGYYRYRRHFLQAHCTEQTPSVEMHSRDAGPVWNYYTLQEIVKKRNSSYGLYTW